MKKTIAHVLNRLASAKSKANKVKALESEPANSASKATKAIESVKAIGDRTALFAEILKQKGNQTQPRIN